MTDKTCLSCGLTLYGYEREGDYCLACTQQMRPHTTYYSTIEGCIRQSTNNPLKEKERENEENPTKEDQGRSL